MRRETVASLPSPILDSDARPVVLIRRNPARTTLWEFLFPAVGYFMVARLSPGKGMFCVWSVACVVMDDAWGGGEKMVKLERT